VKRLTIGMAAFQDFGPTAMTLQALRARGDFDPATMDLLVVDNFGDDRLRALCAATRVRYVRWTEVQGSAPAKGRVFAESQSEWTFCIDPHIILTIPDALSRFLRWADAHPGDDSLLHGPLAYDGYDSGADRLTGETFGLDGVWGQWGGSLPSVDAEPHEIPKMGMGLFGCRTAAWIPFASGLRGFGGEEGILHGKWRNRGRAVRCLPFMRWWHLFRKEPAPYQPQEHDKIRNTVIGFVDAGLDLAPVFARWGDVARKIAAECRRDLYSEAASTPSDISEHVPTLARLATGKRVVEFGVRSGVSTVAFLSGKPASLYSYDVNRCPRAGEIRSFAGSLGVPFAIMLGDSTKTEVDADVCMIDTLHTAAQLRAELANLAPKTRERIVLHDTVTFGEVGEDGGPGLLSPLMELVAGGQWTIAEHHRNNNGLTVLRRAA
jgi:hypothetical protein